MMVIWSEEYSEKVLKIDAFYIQQSTIRGAKNQGHADRINCKWWLQASFCAPY